MAQASIPNEVAAEEGRHEADIANRPSQNERDRSGKLSTDTSEATAAFTHQVTGGQLQSVQHMDNIQSGHVQHCQQQSHPLDNHQARLVACNSWPRKSEVLAAEHHHEICQHKLEAVHEQSPHQQHHLETKFEHLPQQRDDAERQEPLGGKLDCSQSAASATAVLWMPFADGELAARLASRCGIAERTGVVLSVQQEGAGDASGAGVLLRISGTPVANAVACYLLQKAVWLEGALGSSRPS
eukprot:TRINITY_DN9881_c0_g1_i1.p1 TRINITY_DN9881_c0_g1~~TRINITY_DN9881_c0_g1_i1.p1  ORF type:complete len:241 (-),score=43.09 TRINITY_DN9881_c0_g1_i1:359-1081(-)